MSQLNGAVRLTKRFGDTAPLGALDPAPPAGQDVAVLGRSGAGKTTSVLGGVA